MDKCDFDCPPLCFSYKNNILGCCENCGTARKDFAEHSEPTIKQLWDKDVGFAGEKGCKLPRKLMPVECLVYDCKKSKWFLTLEYIPQIKRWQIVSRYSVPLKNVTQELKDKHHDLLSGVSGKF